ncbi:hypothetical protein FKW77_002136 [Venturia effusa]|uniref:Uncharacterized protein n=1 Tax=Venturia effusa TaxID=50376 RepID=A0A517KZ60_9PEZI|nr:hypothetical protein FKW77_002136 [Venturia effusa]
MPPETTLEFTTVGPLGLQRRFTTLLARLSPRGPKIHLGIGNIQRADEGNYTALDKYRRWAQGSTLYVGGNEGSVNSNAPGVWHAVMDHIVQRSARQRGRSPPAQKAIKARNTQ